MNPMMMTEHGAHLCLACCDVLGISSFCPGLLGVLQAAPKQVSGPTVTAVFCFMQSDGAGA